MREGLLERLFGIRAAGSTPGREALGGLATFLTMAYILFVNPVILQAGGMPLAGAIAATAISAGIGTLLMGLLANYPVALAPGMGLNAFFSYGICIGAGVPWQTALGIVFWTGVLFVLLTFVGARSFLVRSVPAVLTRAGAVGIFGHSMGGHGALTIGLKHPDVYRSLSAFAPIAAPSQCPWGIKALGNYLGPDKSTWCNYDATELVARSAFPSEILIDQGTADKFLAEQLHPQLFEAAARRAGQKLRLRMQEGYDHGYFFIQTFMADHLRHHAALLGA